MTKAQAIVGCVAFTVGEVDRVYGGPEEGGWWYDHFEPIRVFMVPARRKEALERRLRRWEECQNEGRRELSSVLSDGRAAVRRGVVGATMRQQYC
jgi:hypothetical protein